MKFIVQSWEGSITDKKKVETLYQKTFKVAVSNLGFDKETIQHIIDTHAFDKTPEELIIIMKELGDNGYFDDAVDLAYQEIERLLVLFFKDKTNDNN